MNSVRLYVRDACGVSHLNTFTANTPENISKFRKHVQQCKAYWKSEQYRKKVHPVRWPVMPVEVVVEEYEDTSSQPHK